MTPEQSAQLREKFPPAAIGKLPKGGAKLDYVGHATVTDRLLTVDPEWSWEPMAFADDGGPLVRYGAKDATLWIRLTVAGVTRIGVGSCNVGAFDVEKQLVGDALRNAAMRFGVALDLWSKEELESALPEPSAASAPAPPARMRKPKDAAPATTAPPTPPASGLPEGWESELACQEAHNEMAARVRALSPDERRKFSERSKEWGARPWTHRQFVAAQQLLDGAEERLAAPFEDELPPVDVTGQVDMPPFGDAF